MDNKEIDEKGLDQEKKYIKTLKERISKINRWMQENDDKIGKSGKPIKSNVTDNDSAKMKTSNGVIQGYDGIASVDDKHQVVVHAEAFGEAQEHDLLQPMVESTRDNLDAIDSESDVFTDAKVTADAGFHNEKNMKYLADNNIDGYVADTYFRKRDPRFNDVEKYKEQHRKALAKKRVTRTFTVDDFRFADDKSYCICPAGKRLYRNGGNTYTNGRHSIRFKGPKMHCVPCKLRAKCLRFPDRTETRAVAYFTGRSRAKEETYTALMKKKIDSDSGRAIYSKRIGTVEPVFAHIRHAIGLDRFTLRGNTRVNIQWKLYCIVHNLLKVHRFAELPG
jgi:hypothetical protein